MRAVVWQQAGVPQATIDGAGQGRRRRAGRAAHRPPPAWSRRATNDAADLPRLKSIAAKSNGLCQTARRRAGPDRGPGHRDRLLPPRRCDIRGAARRDIRACGGASGGRGRLRSRLRATARTSSVGPLLLDRSAVPTLVMLILLPVVVTAIGRPVRALTRTMTELAAGNLDAEAVGQDQRDELGDMARAVLVFKEHMIRAQPSWPRSRRNERHKAEAEKRAALVDMVETIETATGSALQQIGDRTTAMAAAADAMSASANRTGASAQDAAAAASAGAGDCADRCECRRAAGWLDPRHRRTGRRSPPRWSAARCRPAARPAPPSPR